MSGGGGDYGGRGGGGGFGGDRGRNDRLAEFRRKAHIDWNTETLTPFKKDFYKEVEELASLGDEMVAALREELNVTVFGNNVPKPFEQWEQTGLPTSIVQHLKDLNIIEPTPIQRQGIPVALSGGDMVGVSRTGSGKTLAYAMPLMLHIAAQPIVKSGEGPIGLIMAPTRELAKQIDGELAKLCRAQGRDGVVVKHCAVYGGADRHRQISHLRQSPDILVATPGRLIDLVSSNETNLKRTTYLVLDEADRMLEMGFRDDLETIVSYIRPDKQTLMWSATWPMEVREIASSFMNEQFSRIQIGSQELHANSNIQQHFKYSEDMHAKKRSLVRDMEKILNAGKVTKVVVFCNTKRGADELAHLISQSGICAAQAIHGDKSQSSRESIMGRFRESPNGCLVATDVIARGIDVSDIGAIVNFDFPNNVEDYVHRVGRTGRAGAKGIALSYVTDDDIQTSGKKLIKVLENSKQKVPEFLTEKVQLGGSFGYSKRGGGGRGRRRY
jgi:ATP-dependent RNA helicase DDX5/DBP2